MHNTTHTQTYTHRPPPPPRTHTHTHKQPFPTRTLLQRFAEAAIAAENAAKAEAQRVAVEAAAALGVLRVAVA